MWFTMQKFKTRVRGARAHEHTSQPLYAGAQRTDTAQTQDISTDKLEAQHKKCSVMASQVQGHDSDNCKHT